ncbi:cysteinyl-tRNA synthetase, partial [mine drainage metagenome]
NRTIGEITSTYIDSFHSDMNRLKVLPPSVEPRATLYLDHMINLIQRLLDNGHAYIKDGSVYFRVRSYSAYGELSHQQISELRSGARVESDEDKEDPLDFALWKGMKEGEPYYEAPFWCRKAWMAYRMLGDESP